MKKRSAKIYHAFDSTEFLLLAFVAIVLLTFVAWQANLLPPFLTQAVLGTAIGR
ncbi:hypothetical protein HY440_00915 [Candidatus Microgenomates bacterium]|nr:hypothetical protein [Candidatus Microgenomates bacterium]